MSTTTQARPRESGLLPLPEHVEVAIIGSGFAGLGMAIKLTEQGQHDFVVLERAEDIGGTWRDNSYPGCGCDVPSHLYSFSFAPNPEWSRNFAGQGEIWDYMQRVTDAYRLRPHLRFGAEVLSAGWDETANRWQLETARGPMTARVLIAGMGPLSDPAIPDIKGMSSFEGAMFHSATWDHNHDLSGRKVAVIGTGASVIQFVPQIVDQVGRLVLFQRTAPWVLPRANRKVGFVQKLIYRHVPGAQRMVRGTIYSVAESLVLGLSGRTKMLRLLEKQGRGHLANQVPDPGLRAKLTPNFALGCKRMLFSNTYYPALTRPNVEVVTEGIEEILPGGVRTADGVVHEVDTIIFGTGFHVTDMAAGSRVRGVGGKTFDDVWQGSPQAYLGTTVSGFPNLFLLVGPNTGLGHSSIIYMIESQLPYVLGALAYLRESGAAAIDVRPDVQAAFNADLRERLDGTVWSDGGCKSWYIDANGNNSTLWPDFTFRFRRLLRQFDPVSYSLTRAAAPVRSAAAVAD